MPAFRLTCAHCALSLLLFRPDFLAASEITTTGLGTTTDETTATTTVTDGMTVITTGGTIGGNATTIVEEAATATMIAAERVAEAQPPSKFNTPMRMVGPRVWSYAALTLVGVPPLRAMRMTRPPL